MNDRRQLPYVRFPSVRGDTIAFTAEDDLWTVSVAGGVASRLTADPADVAHPHLSPAGDRIAFVGMREGPEEVHVMAVDGGEPRRLTFDGANSTVVGWDGDGILYASNARLPFVRDFRLHRVDADSGRSRQLPYGSARSVSFGPDGGVVIGRNAGGNIVRGRHNAEPATWKRYRGGTAGALWVDIDGDGEFSPLLADLEGNLAHPCWVGDRIFLISDHEGIGNVYSCAPDGTDLQPHSDHERFYARGLSSDGERLVYHSGGRLYLLSLNADGPDEVPVRLPTSRPGRGRRFVDAKEHLDHVTLGPDGDDLALVARGKVFTLAPWEGPARQHGLRDGVHYRLAQWLADHARLVAVAADETPDERLVVLDAERSGSSDVQIDVGRPIEMLPNPRESGLVAIINHRDEVMIVDLDSTPATARTVDRSDTLPPTDLAWSPDGRWIAYTMPVSPSRTEVRIADPDAGTAHTVARPVLRDSRPAWDPQGRYLYFLSLRDFDPVHDEIQFDRGFPLGGRPMLVTLRDDIPSPFLPEPAPVGGDGAATPTREDGETDPLRIDLDGIEQRLLAFPVSLARYQRIVGLPGKVLLSKKPVEGALNSSPFDLGAPTCSLESFDLRTQRTEALADGVSDFAVDRDGETMLLRLGDRLRVLPAGSPPPSADEAGDQPGRSTGFVDLGRVKVSVRPHLEWRQMFRAAWRLQRDHFWTEDMAGTDWADVYDRYNPLIERVSTRSELSDLIWEMQAELSTSHAYELGGDYGDRPGYQQGHLGIDWELDPDDRVRITAIAQGDRWEPSATSALNRPGLDVRVGDHILAVDGLPVGRADDGTVHTPGEQLVNRAGTEVELTIGRDGGDPTRQTVRVIADERPARYRDWVEANREEVHHRSAGQVGYLHIPDMLDSGFGEFHRGFLLEHERDALIVDVRFNRGGHVSPLILEKLARRRRGHFVSRRFGHLPWPEEAARGPIVAITNERAGSDADTFSHVFKQMELGPLIGTRTWGGVVGIWPRWSLADGTVTTQPEMHLTFDDIGQGLENRGADPDIEVAISPQEHARGEDPQLDRAISEILALLNP